MTDGGEMLEPMARAIFAKALTTPGESGKLLWHLFNNGGVTMDPDTRQIVYIPADIISQVAKEAQ